MAPNSDAVDVGVGAGAGMGAALAAQGKGQRPLLAAERGGLGGVGVDPSDPGGAYGLSRQGVIRRVQRTAPSWWKRGARITSLSPGIIDTPMGNQELAQQPMMQGMIDLVGRMGSADEVA